MIDAAFHVLQSAVASDFVSAFYRSSSKGTVKERDSRGRQYRPAFMRRSADFTLATMPGRFASIGDRHAGIDSAAGSLGTLLELSARQEADGLGDAPWPPH